MCTTLHAYRPNSAKEAALDAMLEYLGKWEAHAEGVGFLEGLRVTIHSTKALLKYLTESVGFRYLMMSHLSQDCLERSFGIVRQASGANDHPTPAQFIVIIRCLSFYSLARSPRGASVSPGLLDSLLSAEESLLNGEDEEDAVPLEAVEVAVDHADYVEETSDARLVYYIAGYVARKRVLSTDCAACREGCLPCAERLPADASKEWDLGGLLYPSVSLYWLIQALESRLTKEFSRTQLHSKAALSILQKVSANVPHIGCTEHCLELTKAVVRFFCLTRIHFLLKGLNQKTNESKGKKTKPRVM